MYNPKATCYGLTICIFTLGHELGRENHPCCTKPRFKCHMTSYSHARYLRPHTWHVRVRDTFHGLETRVLHQLCPYPQETYQVFKTLKSPPYQTHRPKIMYYGHVWCLERKNMACELHRNISYDLVPHLLSLDYGMGIENHPWYVN